jgi:hypothetical protein
MRQLRESWSCALVRKGRPRFAGGGGLPDRSAGVWAGSDCGRSAEDSRPAARGAGAVSFTGLDPPWLRDAVKRWARQRLATGNAFNTIRAGAQALKRFSGFLGECQPPVQQPRDIDRSLLDRYLAWLAPLPLADSAKVLSRVFLRSFLEDNRRYHWVVGIPAEATIYPDEISARRRTLPRFIPEFVMNQLESDDKAAGGLIPLGGSERPTAAPGRTPEAPLGGKGDSGE